jgi:DNA-binding transcriptional regulator YiaG
LNLEHEFHHTASELRIFGFKPFKQSLIARNPTIKLSYFRVRTDCQAIREKLQNEIARTLGVSVMTLHRWRKAPPGP